MCRKIRKRKGMIIFASVISIIAIYLIVQLFLCNIAVKNASKRLETYDSKVIELSYGTMTYADKGSGDVILSIHGIFGGYDQGFDTVADMVSDYRIIAPSRFGYLGSDIPENPTPKEQAKAFVELLDELNVDRVYLLATSAGGSVAIRFAVDYPERTKGLILYCSGAPSIEKPDTYSEYAGPPAFLCNNFGMWLLKSFFKPVMGMESSTIYGMLPVNERREGIINDASITNPDMERNYDEYKIEEMRVPVLVFHAKDDKMVDYEQMNQAVGRFPNCTFIVFETGGHLMVGNGEKIDTELRNFLVGG